MGEEGRNGQHRVVEAVSEDHAALSWLLLPLYLGMQLYNNYNKSPICASTRAPPRSAMLIASSGRILSMAIRSLCRFYF
jgi:hypothetical protein